MLAHGFTNGLLDQLARDGLATIQPGTMRAGTGRITVVWVTITEAGQRALAGTAVQIGRVPGGKANWLAWVDFRYNEREASRMSRSISGMVGKRLMYRRPD